MAILVSDVQAAVRAHGFGTDQDANIITLLQQALRKLYGERRWPFLVSDVDVAVSVASVGIVALAAGTQRVESARWAVGTTYYDLKHLSDQDILERRHEDRDTGEPEYWSKVGSNIVIYPRPSAAGTVTLRTQVAPALPTAAGNTINWPDEHADALIFYVLMGLAARQRDWAARDRYRADYLDAVGATYRSQQDDQQSQDTLEVESVDGFGDLWR